MHRVRENVARGEITLLFITMMVVVPFALGYAQERIVHFPVNSAPEGKDIRLEAKLEGTTARVGYMRIYYKYPQQQSYRYREMRPDIERWVGIIPRNEVTGDRLQYFLSAFLDNRVILTFPDRNPYNNPEEIQITPRPAVEKPEQQKDQLPQSEVARLQAPEAAAPTISEASPNKNTPLLLLSPEPNETLAADEVVLAVSLVNEDRVADSSSVQLFMDGQNVTPQATISAVLITYEPAGLQPGRHWFKIAAKDLHGRPVPAMVVNFKVSGKTADEETAAEFQGHIFSDLRQENVSKQNESFAMGGGDFSGQYGALRYTGQVFLTSLEDKNYQPRNRYFLSLQTKWIGATVGDTHPNFNDLILWGNRIRGVGGYVHLGFFNVDAVYGETYRQVEGLGSLLPVLSATGDTLQTVAGTDSTKLSISRYGTFRQKILGIRPSFGSGRHFQLGLSLVKVKDDTGSIKYGAMPKDNLVVGPDFRLALDRGHFVIQAYGAFSLLTNNIYPGPISSDEIKDVFGEDVDIPIDPADLEKYLILNDSTTPLDPTKLTSLAYDATIKLNYFHNLLSIGYKSIGSEYTSLANSWIRKDIQGFYFSDRLRLFNNKLYLTFGYEDYLDNFSRDDSNPSTSLKTLNYAITVYPGQGLPYLNLSLRNHYRDNGVDTLSYMGSQSSSIDTLDSREKQLNRDLAMQLGYDLSLFNLSHSLNVSFMSAARTDDFKSTRLSGNLSQEISTSVRMFSLRTSYQIPLKTTFSYASNENSMAGGDSDFNYSMLGLLAEYNLFNGRLATFGEVRLTNASGQTSPTTKIDYSRNHYRFGGNFQIAPRHVISLDANWILFNNKVSSGSTGNSSYTDGIYRIRYEKFF